MEKPEGVGLVKAPERIQVTEILEVIRGTGPMGAELRSESRAEVDHLLDNRDRAVQEALAGITLRSLVQETHDLQSPKSTSAVQRAAH
jgi:DNA-binding IscR family transcriptional regulator